LLTALSTPFYRKYERRVWRILEGLGKAYFRDFFLGIMSISVYHLLISDDALSRHENLFESCLTEIEYLKKMAFEEDLPHFLSQEDNWEETLEDQWRGSHERTFNFAKTLLTHKIARESGYTLTFEQIEEILAKGINPNEQR